MAPRRARPAAETDAPASEVDVRLYTLADAEEGKARDDDGGDDDDDDDDDDDVSRMPGGGRRTGGESLVREHADVRVVGVRGRVRRGGARRERVRDDARTTGARRGAGSAEDSGFIRRVRENETNFGRCVGVHGAATRGEAREEGRDALGRLRVASELSATTSRFLVRGGASTDCVYIQSTCTGA